MKIIFILTSFFIFGCTSSYKNNRVKSPESSAKIEEPTMATVQYKNDFNFEAFLNNADSANQKMRGEFYREMKRDLSKVNREIYETRLNSYKSSNARELKDSFKKFDIIEVKGYQKTFVICAYSSELEFSFCDDPLCMNVEKTEHSKINKIEDLSKNLPLKSCNLK